MDGFLGESYAIEPDQMQIVNPILILLMVPIFETLIYPCFAKCNLLTPLQRIGTGGILAAVAFIISAIVELQLEVTSSSFIYFKLCLTSSYYLIDSSLLSRLMPKSLAQE